MITQPSSTWAKEAGSIIAYAALIVLMIACDFFVAGAFLLSMKFLGWLITWTFENSNEKVMIFGHSFHEIVLYLDVALFVAYFIFAGFKLLKRIWSER